MQRIGDLQRQAVAALVVLAMLIAPFCAPLCGSRACANSSTQKEDCHNSVAATAETQEPGLGSVGACALGELPTAVLNETTNSPEQIKQFLVLQALPQSLLSENAARIAAKTAIPRPDSESHRNISLDAAILRI
jgi:hypothetical protein